jgi:hypothetical protein
MTRYKLTAICGMTKSRRVILCWHAIFKSEKIYMEKNLSALFAFCLWLCHSFVALAAMGPTEHTKKKL